MIYLLSSFFLFLFFFFSLWFVCHAIHIADVVVHGGNDADVVSSQRHSDGNHIGFDQCCFVLLFYSEFEKDFGPLPGMFLLLW